MQQRAKHEDNNTLKLNQDDRINLMFYAATEGEREISIICDLFIILEISFNKHRERERENRGRREEVSTALFRTFSILMRVIETF